MKLTQTNYKWTNIVHSDGRRHVFKTSWQGGLFPLESDPEQHIAWLSPNKQESTVVVSEQVKQFRRDVLNLNDADEPVSVKTSTNKL